MRLTRRTFCAGAGATALAGLTVPKARGQRRSAAYQMVAETDHERILRAAREYLPLEVLTITAFPSVKSPGGPHDFFSQADYFWPDPKNPDGPYVNRDGQSNPENFTKHREVMIDLSVRMPALTAAWLLTGEPRFAKRAGDYLRAWFVTPATRMNSNLEFSQGVHGVSTGRSYGIIDTLHLVEVARAASFLMIGTPGSGSPRFGMLNAQETTALKSWFSSYEDWLSHSERGIKERDAANNHAFCWALQAAEFARLAGNDTVRKEVYQRYQDVLLPNQVDASGSFPRELARTKPYSYSIFNFDVMAGLCQSLKGLAPDAPTFHLADGRGLCKAAQFIFPYLKDKSDWKWPKDVEHFNALPVRSPGLLFSGIACREQTYIDLWKTLTPDPTDKEIVRISPIRQPLLWI